MRTTYSSLHPSVGYDTGGVNNSTVFALYWSWVTKVGPSDSDKFPKWHHHKDKPVPKRWVKCAMPWAGDPSLGAAPETPWAPVVSPQATRHDAGESYDETPVVGQAVLLGFVGQSYRYPVVVGFISNADNNHATGRADLSLRVTRSGHMFVLDDDAKNKLRKIALTSGMGHGLVMYDDDQGSDPEDALAAHDNQKRSVKLYDIAGQYLQFYCPDKDKTPVYVKLQNKGGKHFLHMQAEPTKFATLGDIIGQFLKLDTDSKSVLVKANDLAQIKSDKAIQFQAGTDLKATAAKAVTVSAGMDASVTAGGALTLSATNNASLNGLQVLLGGGGKKIVLNGDTIVGTIMSPVGPCTFALTVQSSAIKTFGG